MVNDKRVYCTGCGSIVGASDRFCGVCGTGVSPDARSAEVPQVGAMPPSPPSGAARASGGMDGRVLALIAGIFAMVAILLVAGVIVSFNLLNSGDTASSNGGQARIASQNEAGTPTANDGEPVPPGTSPFGETYPYTLEKAAISEIQVSGP